MPQQLAWDDKQPQQQAQPAQSNRFDWGDEQQAPPQNAQSTQAPPAQSASQPSYWEGAKQRAGNFIGDLGRSIAHISAPGIAASILEAKAPNWSGTKMLQQFPHSHISDLPGEIVGNTLPFMVGGEGAPEVQTPETVTPPMGPAAEAPIIPKIMQGPRGDPNLDRLVRAENRPGTHARMGSIMEKPGGIIKGNGAEPQYPTGRDLHSGMKRINDLTSPPRSEFPPPKPSFADTIEDQGVTQGMNEDLDRHEMIGRKQATRQFIAGNSTGETKGSLGEKFRENQPIDRSIPKNLNSRMAQHLSEAEQKPTDEDLTGVLQESLERVKKRK